MEFGSSCGELRVCSKDEGWSLFTVAREEHLPPGDVHGIGESEDVVLVRGDGIELAVTGKTRSRPGWRLHERAVVTLGLQNADALGADAHHEGKRPGGDVVGFEDAAVRGGLDFGIALDAKHFVYKAPIGLRSGD